MIKDLNVDCYRFANPEPKKKRTNYDLNFFSKGKAFLHREELIDGKIEIGKMFCINTNGEVLFMLPDVDMICISFHHNDVTDVFYNDKHALINTKGEFLTEFVYDSINTHENKDFCEVIKDSKFGIIDINGKEILPCIYDDCDICYDNQNLVTACLDGNYGMIDMQNNIIIPFMYDELREPDKGLIIARSGEKFGVINKQNEVVIDFKYKELCTIDGISENIFIAQLNNCWGVIDKDENIIEEFIYDEADCGNGEELCAFGKDGKFALYSTLHKQFITDFIYKKENSTDKTINPYSCIYYPNNFDFIDVYGKSAIKLCYDEFFEEYFSRCSEGIAIVTKEGKYGAIDKDWNIVIPFEYKKLSEGDNGLISAEKVDGSDGYIDGYIDKNGNPIIPFGKYCYCQNFHDGYAIAYKEGTGSVYIDTKGNILKIKGIEK